MTNGENFLLYNDTHHPNPAYSIGPRAQRPQHPSTDGDILKFLRLALRRTGCISFSRPDRNARDSLTNLCVHKRALPIFLSPRLATVRTFKRLARRHSISKSGKRERAHCRGKSKKFKQARIYNRYLRRTANPGDGSADPYMTILTMDREKALCRLASEWCFAFGVSFCSSAAAALSRGLYLCT